MAWLRGAADIGFCFRQHVEGAQQIFTRESRGQRLDAVALPFAGNLWIGDARRIDRQDEEIAHDARQLAAHGAKVVAHFDGARGQGERRGRVLVGDRLNGIQQQIAPHQPEHRRHVVGRHGVSREGDHLIELALRVAHAAFAIARDQLQGFVGDRDPLGVDDPPQLLADRLAADRPELVHLRARTDGFGNLLQLGRRHHEHDVRRRFLDRFQQRVE